MYYYARDFLPKQTWLNLNWVKQEGEAVEGMAEGAFNFGPANASSPLLHNLRKNSKFMGDTVITFRGNLQNDDG